MNILTENYKLYLGDCLEVMKEIPDKSVDMILCDLPYGVTARNKWDTVIPFDELWKQYNRVIKDNGAIVLFAQGIFTEYGITFDDEAYGIRDGGFGSTGV